MCEKKKEIFRIFFWIYESGGLFGKFIICIREENFKKIIMFIRGGDNLFHTPPFF